MWIAHDFLIFVYKVFIISKNIIIYLVLYLKKNYNVFNIILKKIVGSTYFLNSIFYIDV